MLILNVLDDMRLLAMDVRERECSHPGQMNNTRSVKRERVHAVCMSACVHAYLRERSVGVRVRAYMNLSA